MKYNLIAKSLFEVFKDEKPRYVRLAADSLKYEQKGSALLLKKYGPKYDGVGATGIYSYMEKQSLEGVLIRIDSRIKAIKVLAEIENEKDSQILSKFYNKNDVQILNMMNSLSKTKKEPHFFTSKNAILTKLNATEELLKMALEHTSNVDHRRIYMYYYGIGRKKLGRDSLLKVFSEYNAKSIKAALLDVQVDLPYYIDMERKNYEDLCKQRRDEQRKAKKPISKSDKKSGPGLKYDSLFDYFYDINDSIELKAEKKQIILDYINNFLKEETIKLLKKIFGKSFDKLQANLNLTKQEKSSFNYITSNMRKYLNRIILLRHGGSISKVRKNDPVILTKDNDFKEDLKEYFLKRIPLSLSLEVFQNYLSQNSEDKTFISKFYDLDTMKLRDNVYSSKADAIKIRNIFKNINTSVKSLNMGTSKFKESFMKYFLKVYTSNARKKYLHDLVVEYIDTFNKEEKELLQKLYGNDYNILNDNVEVTQSEIDMFNVLIERITEYVNHINEMLGTYKSNLFTYNHKNGMTTLQRRNIDKNFREYLDNSSSVGKLIAVKLYGESYDKLNPTVYLSKEEAEIFNSFIDSFGLVSNSFKKTFLQYFIKNGTTVARKQYLYDLVVKYIDTFNREEKELLQKLYESDYNKLNVSAEITPSDIDVFNQLVERITEHVNHIHEMLDTYKSSLYTYFHTAGLTAVERKIADKIVKEYLDNSSSEGKLLIVKLYGASYDKLNPEVYLSEKEVEIFNPLLEEINSYIENRKKESKAQLSIPTYFLSFLEKFDTSLTLEELTEKVKEYISRNTSKEAAVVRRLYDEDFKLKEDSNELTSDEINSICCLIKRIKGIYYNEKAKDDKKTIKLPNNVLDNLTINYNEIDKDLLINRINFNISRKDSIISSIFHQVYGPNLDQCNANEVTILKKDFPLLKQSIVKLNEFFSEELVNYDLKEDLLEYIYPDLSNRVDLVEKLRTKIDELKGANEDRFRKMISFIYNDDFKLVKPMLLRKHEISAFEISIKKLLCAKSNNNKDCKNYFFDNFLFDGETVVPEDRKIKILQLCRASKLAVLKKMFDIYGTNLDRKVTNQYIINKERKNINKAVKVIMKRLTTKRQRQIFMLADNFINQFYIESDTLSIREAIKYYIIGYLNKTRSKQKDIVCAAYDKDYNLKKEYIFDGNKNVYRNFIKLLASSVNDYRKSLTINNPNIPSFGKDENECLSLTDDLLDIMAKGSGMVDEQKNKPFDELLKNAYNEYNDSKTIMDLLMISSETLVDFYLNHIDDLDDPSEAFNYLIHLGDKDIIKRLMVSPLFLRVINYIPDIERQIIYLKLVQVNNESLTDEKISKITHVDIETINEYQIMTKEDKVNKLNEFIKKRK